MLSCDLNARTFACGIPRIALPASRLGTDAFDNGPEQNWGMVAWFGAHSAREALGVALAGMMRDGEIDRPRAEVLARMVLRENAIRAYHLGIR